MKLVLYHFGYSFFFCWFYHYCKQTFCFTRRGGIAYILPRTLMGGVHRYRGHVCLTLLSLCRALRVFLFILFAGGLSGTIESYENCVPYWVKGLRRWQGEGGGKQLLMKKKDWNCIFISKWPRNLCTFKTSIEKAADRTLRAPKTGVKETHVRDKYL